MTREELVGRFPEIPQDLHTETSLETFAQVFDRYLVSAAKPSACSDDWNPENRAYMKLVGPMDIYRYGLSTRERVLQQIDELIGAYKASPDEFEREMMLEATDK